jgi:hypothetical protein
VFFCLGHHYFAGGNERFFIGEPDMFFRFYRGQGGLEPYLAHQRVYDEICIAMRGDEIYSVHASQDFGFRIAYLYFQIICGLCFIHRAKFGLEFSYLMFEKLDAVVGGQGEYFIISAVFFEMLYNLKGLRTY